MVLEKLRTFKWSLEDCFETDCLILIRLLSVLEYRKLPNEPTIGSADSVCLSYGLFPSINMCT